MTVFTKIPKQVEEVMEKMQKMQKWNGSTSRRNFLKGSGLLVVSLSAAAMANASLISPAASAQAATAAQAAGPYPDPDFRQIDSWIVIHEDSTATFYVGKTDGGQGTGTAFRQMMADELDIAFNKTDLIMGRTDITVDQGDRAVLMVSRGMARPCGAWLLRPGESCWRWHPRGLGRPSINSPSARA